MAFTLTVYRGEKKQWWPAPEIRLMYGMTLYQPWLPASTSSLFSKLCAEVKGQLGLNVSKKVAAYAQFLRATGRPFAVATAWTAIGSFTSDYNYVIEIPNVRVFAWAGGKDAPALGAELTNVTHPSQVNQDFIVLNAATVVGSTVLGFGHNTATKEITFLHDLPIGFIKKCNGTSTKDLAIKKWSDLSFDEKVKYSKFKR